MEDLNESIEIARLFQEVMGLFKHNMGKIFEDIGITPPQGMTMGILCKQKKMKITELSSKLNLSNSTVSGIIDRLEKQGLVERERSEEDRRVVYVSICPKFYTLHENFLRRFQENIEKVMNKGDAEDHKKIVEGLNTLKKLLGDR
jgi:MarR family transcriptional regulator, organic hydroperoxide resistance regulator